MPEVIPFAAPHDTSMKNAPSTWTFAKLVSFRMAFVYLLLTAVLWIFEFADKATAMVARPFQAVWRPFVVWTAAHVYGWHEAIALNFVRDTRYLYSLLTCFLVFSVVAAIVWSIADRKRREYDWLNDLLRVAMRYTLVYLLLHYGMDKVFLLQFPAPTFARLTERVGDYSPSSLMWTFIGSSTVYTVFGGVAEILGAVFLLFRRTTTLGALIAFAVMFNVTVMDFSYDVAVKLLCLHILLMAVYLVLPDVGRLLDFFLLNRGTTAARLGELKLVGGKRIAVLVLKVAVIVYLFASISIRDWHGYKQTGSGAARPPLYGLYAVEEFRLGGVVHPPLITDVGRWRYVMLETPGTLAVRRMDESLVSYRVDYDAAQRQMRVTVPEASGGQSALKVTELDRDTMQMDGSWGGAPLTLKLRKLDPKSFTLTNRGFRWISETSFIQ